MMRAFRLATVRSTLAQYKVAFFLALLAAFVALSSTLVQAQTLRGDVSMAVQPPGEGEEPENKAQMIIQSVPSSMITGRDYPVSISMRNTGTKEWYQTLGYRLVSVSPPWNMTWGLNQRLLETSMTGLGNTAQFDFQVKAPSTPGTYTFQWQMSQDGAGFFGNPTNPVTVYVRAPIDNAQVVSQTIPTTVRVGQRHEISVTMRNNGDLSWTRAQKYVLMSQNPANNMTWGVSSVPLPVDTVNPGESATFRFEVTAPDSANTYASQWSMQRDGAQFGVWTDSVAVNVVEPVNNAQATAHSASTQMVAGRSYNVAVTMYNNGESTWTWAKKYTLMPLSPPGNEVWGFNRVPLPVDNIAPGQSVTFNFPVTAPRTPGSYAMQWGMQREGFGSFGLSTSLLTVNVAAPYNDAAVVKVTVPAQMQTKSGYDVSVTMRNTGTTTWAPGTNYKLGSLNPQDNLIWGVNRIPLTMSVAPGQDYTFTFRVTAPVPDDYDMQWRMVQEAAGWFGKNTSNAVTVTEDLSRVTFIHTDGLGSPVARTNGAKEVISRTRYEPYGYVASGAAPTIGFTGHVNDADTGLTYMQQRYYDPVAGRFLSVDPVTTDANSGGSFNRYAYANNSPYKYIDPDGREGQLFWTAKDKVNYTIKYTLSGVSLPFTPAAMSAQIARDFSGTVNIGGTDVTITAQAVLASACGPGVASVQVVADTAGVTKSGRSEVDSIGGNFVTLGAGGAQAATPLTASHEIGGHVGGAGDQYAGGIGANGKTLTAAAPGADNVMKSLSGQRANQQSLKEIITAKTNTNRCTSGVSAANGGC